jgi:hypothetical protein
MTIATIDCRQFEERLSEYMENALSLPQHSSMEAHAAACAECGALLADLRSIVARAGSLPVLTPSRDLWDGIADRLDAPVIAIDGAPSVVRQRRVPRWAGFAAAAAVLMAVTSLATRELVRRDAPSASVAEAPQATEPAPVTSLGTDTPAVRSEPSVRPAATSGTAPRSETRRTAAETYRSEIAVLERAVAQRDSALDPATLAIIQNSLRIIDSAIVEARAALARDPASRFLKEQVDKTLHKKMELLRSVAVLAART